MINQSFNRIEKKYLLSKTQYEKLISLINPYVIRDQYYAYSIHNIYYDSADNYLIRNSLDKPSYKEKLRVRSYGEAQKDDSVFVEIKKKVKDTVIKRRVSLPYDKAVTYLNASTNERTTNQVLNEITYLKNTQHLVPKLYLAYDRYAYYAAENPDLRITFDYHIRSRTNNLSLKDNPDNQYLLKDDEMLLEIKAQGAYPLWLCNALNTLQIYPISFSKYGMIYANKIKLDQSLMAIAREMKMLNANQGGIVNVQ